MQVSDTLGSKQNRGATWYSQGREPSVIQALHRNRGLTGLLLQC